MPVSRLANRPVPESWRYGLLAGLGACGVSSPGSGMVLKEAVCRTLRFITRIRMFAMNPG